MAEGDPLAPAAGGAGPADPGAAAADTALAEGPTPAGGGGAAAPEPPHPDAAGPGSGEQTGPGGGASPSPGAGAHGAPDPAADGAPDPAGPGAGSEAQDGPPVLDPAAASLRRGPAGELRLGTGTLSHLRVSCYRAFPLSAVDRWIVFFDGAGKHVGVLEDVSALDPESAALCREELELRYVVPVAAEVLAVREEYGDGQWNPAQVWDVETDRGPVRLHLPNLAEHVRAVGDGRLLFTDRDGRRCLLRPAALDPRSRGIVGRYLWLDGLE